MNGTDFQLDQLSDECLQVLGSYAVREIASKKANPESNGWLDRLADVPGVDATAMTTIHGILIAEGMLKFEITGRSVGLQYQVSPAGKEALNRHQRAQQQTEADQANEDELQSLANDSHSYDKAEVLSALDTSSQPETPDVQPQPAQITAKPPEQLRGAA